MLFDHFFRPGRKNRWLNLSIHILDLLAECLSMALQKSDDAATTGSSIDRYGSPCDTISVTLIQTILKRRWSETKAKKCLQEILYWEESIEKAENQFHAYSYIRGIGTIDFIVDPDDSLQREYRGGRSVRPLSGTTCDRA